MGLKRQQRCSYREPQINTIILIKEDLPRGTWKIGKIIDLPVSYDGQIRSAKIMLPSKRLIIRTINFVYPLECDEISSDKDFDRSEVKEVANRNNEQSNNNIRLTRRAASEARNRIRQWTSDNSI